MNSQSNGNKDRAETNIIDNPHSLEVVYVSHCPRFPDFSRVKTESQNPFSRGPLSKFIREKNVCGLALPLGLEMVVLLSVFEIIVIEPEGAPFKGYARDR